MSDIESRLSDVALQVSTLKGHWDNGLSLLMKVMQDVPRLKTEIENLKNQLASHKSEVAKGTEEVSKLKYLVATVREEFSRNLTTVSEGLVKSVDLKHGVVLQKLTQNSGKIDHFESLIEEIAMNSKNACLKADNADMQTMLNKKKVEAVHLLVQNQQLKK